MDDDSTRKRQMPPTFVVLQRLMDHYGVTSHSQLAKRIGVAQTTVSTWSTKNSMSYDCCIEAAQQSGESLDFLILGRTHSSVVRFDALQVAIEAALFHILLDLEPWGEGVRRKSDRERVKGTQAQNNWRRAISAHLTETVAALYAELMDPDGSEHMKNRRPCTTRLGYQLSPRQTDD